MWFVKRDNGWALEAERPAKTGHWSPIHLPALPFAVEAHTGTGSDPSKWAALTVLACDRHGELLVETNGTKSYTYADRTVEGRRLVRSVIKVMKVLAFLARKGATARAKAERAAAFTKSREGRDGTCQICEGRFIADKVRGTEYGLLVLHGYERPGIGYAVGRCFGVGELTWEVSCGALRRWVVVLAGFVEQHISALAAARDAEVVYKDKWTGKYKMNKPEYERVAVHPGEPEFVKIKASNIRAAEARLDATVKEKERQEARLAAWKPAKGVA